MPKLNKTQAQTTAATDAWEAGTGRSLLPEGRYAAQLFTVTEREGQKAPVWSWRLVNVHDQDGNPQGRVNMFHSTSLSEAAAGGLRQTFDAFGYSPDSDTDEMLGEWVVMYVVQEVAAQGKNAGNVVNRVASVAPFLPEDWPFDTSAVPTYTERAKGTAAPVARDDDSF